MSTETKSLTNKMKRILFRVFVIVYKAGSILRTVWPKIRYEPANYS